MKKVSSVVWQFFDRLEENKRCVAVLCKLCENEYKYFGNTTNLRAHLMKKHPIQWEFRQSDVLKGNESNSRIIFDDDESTNHSAVASKRRKYTRGLKDKNVRYSLSIRSPDSGATGADSMPKIEIQRVDVLEGKLHEDDDDNEDNEATVNLVRQMHDVGSDEEWLEEDFPTQVEIYEQKRKRSQPKYPKIKREIGSPPSYIIRNQKQEKSGCVIIDDSRKDEYTVFGEYIANKLRKFKTPRTRGNIQQLITTILWQAEYGMFDDADSVKRILMCSVQDNRPVQTVQDNVQHITIQTEEEVESEMQGQGEQDQLTETEAIIE